QIFGVIPASDGHDGAMDIRQMWSNVACLPVCVIGRVTKELGPFRRAAIEQPLFRIAERSHPQKKIIAVRSFEIIRLSIVVKWIFRTLGKLIEEPKILGQEPGTIVVKVVANEPI